ncbi:hypothetical protein [Francisella sp. SYW-2]|uniref:hypothetical protein n=1 Tax=Francisella sp. SYW-2 TaxID=2610886 RepID=UPI00123E15DC|nr:hypothetical protein [Francisella sp. SYW-2]
MEEKNRMEENNFKEHFLSIDLDSKNTLFEQHRTNKDSYLNYNVITVEGYCYKKFETDDTKQAEYEFNQCSQYYSNIIDDTENTVFLEDNFLITPYIDGEKPDKGEIISYLNDLQKSNLFITDPVPENFAFKNDKLRLIDFGSTWYSDIEDIDASIKEIIIKNFYKGGYKIILLLEPETVMYYLTKIVAFELDRHTPVFVELNPLKIGGFKKELKKFFINESCEYDLSFEKIWGKLPDIEVENSFEDMEPFSL